MSLGPKQHEMAMATFLPIGGYIAYLLSHPMRENGCLSCLASMLKVLAFSNFSYLRVGY